MNGNAECWLRCSNQKVGQIAKLTSERLKYVAVELRIPMVDWAESLLFEFFERRQLPKVSAALEKLLFERKLIPYLRTKYSEAEIEFIRRCYWLSWQALSETTNSNDLDGRALRAFIEQIVALANSRESKAPVDVSIIIPVHNGLHLTLGCIFSLLANTSEQKYEVIVGDNLSNDMSEKILSALPPPIRYVRHKENLGFVGNCNACAAIASGRYLVFLNNDVLVMPGWLNALVAATKAIPRAGVVGSKLIFPHGFLQEAGSIVWNDGSTSNFGRGQNPAHGQCNYIKECDYVSAAGVLILKSVWELLGGFDREFFPAYYDDTDFCFRARERGYQTIYQPDAELIHYENRTHAIILPSGIATHMAENRQKFLERWRNVLARDACAPKTALFLARDRSKDTKHALIVAEEINPEYVARFYKEISKSPQCWRITYWGLKQNTKSAHTLSQSGIEVLTGPRKELGRWIRKNGDFINVGAIENSLSEELKLLRRKTGRMQKLNLD